MTNTTLYNKLSNIASSTANIRAAIVNKGQTPSGGLDTFATAISNIPTSGSSTDFIVLDFGATAATETLIITVNNTSININTNGITSSIGTGVSSQILLPTNMEVSFYIGSGSGNGLELYVNDSSVRTGDSFTYTFQSNSTATLEFHLGCCIPYYTSVNYSDGTTKSAENVKIGDKLLGYNTLIGAFDEVEVTDVIHKLRSDLVEVKTENYEIEITTDHPILTDKGWAVYDTSFLNYQGLNKVKLDTSLKALTKEGTYEQIMSLSLKQLDNPIDTYTFNTTDGIDTYVASGLVSHNAPC